MENIATKDDYQRIPQRLHYVLDALSGTGEDWLDAIEAIGVRPAYYDGSHKAYLGKDRETWTNAVIAHFLTKEAAHEWCDRVNNDLEIE